MAASSLSVDAACQRASWLAFVWSSARASMRRVSISGLLALAAACKAVTAPFARSLADCLGSWAFTSTGRCRRSSTSDSWSSKHACTSSWVLLIVDGT